MAYHNFAVLRLPCATIRSCMTSHTAQNHTQAQAEAAQSAAALGEGLGVPAGTSTDRYCTCRAEAVSAVKRGCRIPTLRDVGKQDAHITFIRP